MMFPIYDVKRVGDKWAVLEVHAYKTKTHSDGYDTEADALVKKGRLERAREKHIKALQRGPGADGREGRAVENCVKFGSKKSKKLIEEDEALNMDTRRLEELVHKIERQFCFADFEMFIKFRSFGIEAPDPKDALTQEQCREVRRAMIRQVLDMADRAGLVLVEKGGS